MNCILLGAGSSKSYLDSPTKVQMPIAKDFFKTFFKLQISENPWVLYHHVLTFLNQHKHTDINYLLSGNVDIEEFHSEIEEACLEAHRKHDKEKEVLNF